MQLDLLDHLLTLAGPQDAEVLLYRLDQDLFQAHHDIELAAGQNDRKSLCNALHVLLGVSGSIGADALYKLAEQVHSCAKSAAPLQQADLDSLLLCLGGLRSDLQRRRQSGETTV